MLWLGNIRFERGQDDNASVPNPEAVETAARLLKCPKSELESAILTRKVVTKADSYVVQVFSYKQLIYTFTEQYH